MNSLLITSFSLPLDLEKFLSCGHLELLSTRSPPNSAHSASPGSDEVTHVIFQSAWHGNNHLRVPAVIGIAVTSTNTSTLENHVRGVKVTGGEKDLQRQGCLLGNCPKSDSFQHVRFCSGFLGWMASFW